MPKVTTNEGSTRRTAILKTYRDATDVPLVILALCTIPLLVAGFEEKMTVVAADGCGFRTHSFFVLGREEGRPFQFNEDSVRLLADGDDG